MNLEIFCIILAITVAAQQTIILHYVHRLEAIRRLVDEIISTLKYHFPAPK